jgi:ring-1,2-phenylacetyl-CoA epoxidase subunit PaaD
VVSVALTASPLRRAWAVLDTVMDPEVPALSVCDLGIVRDIEARGDGVHVVLTPTYSGCPATEVIERSVVEALEADGFAPVTVALQRASVRPPPAKPGCADACPHRPP